MRDSQKNAYLRALKYIFLKSQKQETQQSMGSNKCKLTYIQSQRIIFLFVNAPVIFSHMFIKPFFLIIVKNDWNYMQLYFIDDFQ